MALSAASPKETNATSTVSTKQPGQEIWSVPGHHSPTQDTGQSTCRELPSIVPARLGVEAQEQQPPDPQVAALAQ